MARTEFTCIDAHTCGNPVRVIKTGVPDLVGTTMSHKRQDFLKHHDWIRKALMFEPRGHDMMSGSVIYPPISPDADAAILFVETSGCLPMCGHGLIGTVTVGIEEGLIRPKTPGVLILDVPAGKVRIKYFTDGDKVTSVRIYNIASYLAVRDAVISVPGMGEITIDVSYGGNYYAVVDPQKNYAGLEHYTPGEILRLSLLVRQAAQETITVSHPDDPTVCGVSHVLWTGTPTDGADGRNAVFYGDKAIDRSPCGTGTSARMAQLVARGKLDIGDQYIHESIIHSRFIGRVEASAKVGSFDAIMPSIEGSAWITGYNRIIVDDAHPYPEGFQLV
ncbi:hypothetical protein GCM10017044_27380 [Kordiimonas sediminis]|uniref:4-hydroxyproline epimerase n=1 Tax=Kordiimonas sediminis TaxID=1735581 RepID=A0A919AXL6_9PROT|nr:4-hydroxyproline epimerase [Kordiimonas sediminis]GHF30524.1 hypothetical protein GCM10017044_27380 [Kordiimonas sediminis]